MSEYAIEVLTDERDKLKEAMHKLHDEFCHIPSYDELKQGKVIMPVEVFEKQMYELVEKLSSIEHTLTTCCILERRKK